MKSKISAIVFLFSGFVLAQNPLKVLHSDFQSVILEFASQYSQTTIKINNQDFLQIGFSGYYSNDLMEWGEPEIPLFRFNVGVPSETGNTIEVLNVVYNEISGRLVPLPKLVKDNELDRFEYEINESYYAYRPEEELVTFGDYGIARDLKIQSIKVLPVKFNPASENIRLYSKIIFRINFAPSLGNPNAVYDDFISGSVVNYETARYWKQESKRILTVTNSVLASGKWVRFEAAEEGIYKITRQMLSSFGINPGTVDPRTIKIYNNGGKMLSEDAGAVRPIDLEENAVWVIGEDDGNFDENDYILFYGRGNKFWDYDASSRTIKRYFHHYSNVNYYWITASEKGAGGSPGKRIQEKPSLNVTPEYTQTTTSAFADWEVDKINPGKSGRIFLGDDFSQSVPSRIYMNMLDHRVESKPLSYRFRFVNGSSGSFILKVYENSVNQEIYSQVLTGYGANQYSAGISYNGTATFSGSLPENRSALKFEIGNTSGTSVGYLDYFEIYFEKNLIPISNYLMFFSKDTSAIIEYQLSNFPTTNIKVFDVTDYSNIKLVTPKPGWPSGGNFYFQFQENTGSVSKYIAIGNDEFKTPVNPVEVDNSNLRGITEGARFIIVTHKNFKEAANRLKNYRENEAKVPISTVVVDVEQIFNEFSCGILDVSAIRDFIKYTYTNWTIKPEYVLFFGSGNYDFKNIEGYNSNFVPTWQSVEGLALLNSYTTDDFFVKVDPGNDSKIDLTPGRLTVKTLTEAHNIVDKIIEYENDSDIGLWRNVITLVADDAYTTGDGYSSSEIAHTIQTESIAVSLPAYYDINKIFMATYPAVLTGSGRRMPEVNAKIIESINSGSLAVNYIGHGNEAIWAHEVVFDKNVSIPQLRNKNKYFFFFAATCSFGYFDIPNLRSGAENLIFQQNAGSIAGLVAARLVFSTSNFLFNRAYYQQLFGSPRDSAGLPITIGKANFETKQNYTDSNSQRYILFGDPTLRLNMPLHKASIDSINGQATVSDIQVKALSKVTLNGNIVKPDSSSWENYNGEAILNIYDSERTRIIQFETSTVPVVIPGGIIFRGRISVANGKFDADFIVPKDISYENKRGKVVLYFYSNNEDGLGFTDKIIVGGTDTTANDGKGPEIEIFFDDISYSGSYLINPDSRLIIRLFDETGINTTGTGVGHALQGVLNNKETDPIDFTNYFTGDLDAGGKSGEINYPFSNLETGDHHLKVQAWDVFNNFSSEETYFSVVTGDDLVLRDVYNYPNPFKLFTTFTFQQNLNSIIDCEVIIYTLAGRQIKIINKNSINDKFVRIDWDGRDNDGDLIANGTYLYKLKVSTVDGDYSKSVLGKLSVIR
jgi:hypothetical protein